jgi:hypothetical protein
MAVNTKTEEGKPAVDPSKPTTDIRFRFHNGQSATLTVNLTCTVGDLHMYVMHAAPTEGSYVLMEAGRPPKQLNNPNLTVEAAKL